MIFLALYVMILLHQSTPHAHSVYNDYILYASIIFVQTDYYNSHSNKVVGTCHTRHI